MSQHISQAPAQDTEDFTVELTIRVKVRKPAGADINDFIENLEYSVVSNTDGVTVLDTEMTDAEVEGA